VADVLSHFSGIRKSGAGWTAKCPAHDDSRASLSIRHGDDGRWLLHCHAGCTFDDILTAAQLKHTELFPPKRQESQPRIVATYDYTDEHAILLYQAVRYHPKDFRQRRPGSNGTPWIWRLDKTRRVLYRLPQLQGQTTIYVCEGEKDCDRLASLGLPATCNAGGAGKWREEYTQQLQAAGVQQIVILPDNDAPGRNHADEVARLCHAAGLQVKIVTLPGLTPKGDVSDWLDESHTKDELMELAKTTALYTAAPVAAAIAPRTLDDTIAVFRRWLYLDDPSPVYAVAATLVANRAPGDPVWLLLVCAPSTGKTEILSAASRLPWVISAAKVTEASLLSGTSKRECVSGATGGLLRQLGTFGVLLCKDFTSVLAQNFDARAEAMAALREIYDGKWDRPVGTDGGKVLTWAGKCGLIGGVTPALDQYGQVLAALGDRFVLLRMPDASVEDCGQAALSHGDHEQQMRAELSEALAGLVEHADIRRVNRPLTKDERRRLIDLAAYTARTRTAVARDGYHHDVLYAPQVEGPGRLLKVLARLLGGLEAIGCDESVTWETLRRIAVDCAPSLRTRLIRELLRRAGPARTSDLAAAVEMVTKTASRHLEDLSLLKLAVHTKQSHADNAPDLWAATDWLREKFPLPVESETEKYPPAHKTQVTGDTQQSEDAHHGPVDFGPTFEQGADGVDANRPPQSATEKPAPEDDTPAWVLTPEAAPEPGTSDAVFAARDAEDDDVELL